MALALADGDSRRKNDADMEKFSFQIFSFYTNSGNREKQNN